MNENEFIFESDPNSGYHFSDSEAPGPHSEGDTLEGKLTTDQEAFYLYVTELQEEDRDLDMDALRRTLPLLA